MEGPVYNPEAKTSALACFLGSIWSQTFPTLGRVWNSDVSFYTKITHSLAFHSDMFQGTTLEKLVCMTSSCFELYAQLPIKVQNSITDPPRSESVSVKLKLKLTIYMHMHVFTHFQISNGHVWSSNQVLPFKVFSGFEGHVGNNFGVERRNHLESHAGSRCAHLAPVEARNAPSPFPRWII